jgi:hypothetical protein
LWTCLQHLDAPPVDPAAPADDILTQSERDSDTSSISPSAQLEDSQNPVEKGLETSGAQLVARNQSSETLATPTQEPDVEKKPQPSLPDKSSSDATFETETPADIVEAPKSTPDLTFRDGGPIIPPPTASQTPTQHPSEPPSQAESPSIQGKAPATEPGLDTTTRNYPAQEDKSRTWQPATLKDILALAGKDFARRAADRSNDASAADDEASSLNTRLEIWTISSFRSGKPVPTDADADSVHDLVCPPDTLDDQDWSLPLDSLLKPIKKNTYGPVHQGQVSEFLEEAKWGAEPEKEKPAKEEKDDALWTAKRIPSQMVDYPPGAESLDDQDILPDPEYSRRPTNGDPFLESIEDKEGRLNDWPPPRPRRFSEGSRELQYPGPTVLYEGEYFRESTSGATSHRVYIKQISTQSPTPDYYLRRRPGPQNPPGPPARATALPPQPEIPPEPQPPIHKVPSLSCFGYCINLEIGLRYLLQ